ncbi:DUF5685 family protein [Glycomyces buryatensis]|uniref:Regulatory protein n=1 Tax=Glycomyces buryatensis TaxID=2570927 RepID=A0A4S8QI25_9ACTN|nr:DUF5685 family protein [Glycomyces buryatensis]THV42635.1 hypothetical protein FAB82_05565 [Glycomyces buryatensis]
MFGILAPCPSRTPEALKPRWMGHFCGLCLELRDDAGHLARLTTNYDALALSVLVEAQGDPDADSRTAGPCALRGMRRQRIATGNGPRLAATASLLLASAKLRDHVEDGDGFVARPGARGLAGATADRYRTKATVIGETIDLPTARVIAAIERQQSVEAACGPTTPLTDVTAPTEEATAELFAHAAFLADRPENAGAFRTAGRAFGRLAHLLDAADDFEEDAARGAWNPLAATGTGVEGARALARGALADMRAALEAATFVDEAMVHLLLDRYARHAVSKTFGSSCAASHHHEPGASYSEPGADPRLPGGPPRESWPPGYERPEETPPDKQGRPKRPRIRGFWGGLCIFTALCCTCQSCCRSEYEDPWTGESRSGCCHQAEGCGEGCNCCGECCGNCGDCCNCCSSDGCCGDCGCDCSC